MWSKRDPRSGPKLPLVRPRQGVGGRGMNARETSADYPNIVARLSDKWRVIVCAGGLQWILQKRDAGNAPSIGWRGVGYCMTREALLRLCGGLESPVDPSARPILAALPEHIAGGVA